MKATTAKRRKTTTARITTPSLYAAVIDGKEGAYGVIFPDAPGCTAMGDTIDEAFENAIEALSEWAGYVLADDELAMPAPRSMMDITTSGEAKGGFIAAVPLLLETGKTKVANLSLDAGILSAIDSAAKRRGETRSAFVSTAAVERLKRGG